MAAVNIDNASGGYPGVLGRLGPYMDNSGALFVVMITNINGFYSPAIYRSINNGISWSMVKWNASDFANSNPLNFSMDSVFDSTNQVIYIVVSTRNSTTIVYKYNIADNTFLTIISGGTAPIVSDDVNNTPKAFITRKSNGDFRIFYQGNLHAMGQDYRAVFYVPLTAAGIWGTPVAVASLKGTPYSAKGAVLGASDRVHMIWVPAGVNSPISHRSLSSTDVLDTTGSVIASTQTDSNYFTIYYDATLGKLVVTVATSGVKLSRASSVANPTWTADANSVSSTTNLSTPMSIIYESISAKLYAFYQGLNSDLYENTAPSTTWETESLLDVATNVIGISVGLITDGIGIVYNDNGTVYFDKLVLTAPVLPTTQHPNFFDFL